ncbi:hypothetical protein RQP46_008046 [Phenoliferia psychrophenolica]
MSPQAVRLLIINPNSSASITVGLKEALDPFCPPGVELTYYTAPEHAPPSINDFCTASLTAVACYEDIKFKGLHEVYDGFLVCCFSDHPLQHMLRELLGPSSPRLCIGIFEAGVATALLLSYRFGVISTGTGLKPLMTKGVSSVLGANSSDRWAGVVTTGLGVVELRDGDPKKIKECMKKASAELLSRNGIYTTSGLSSDAASAKTSLDWAINSPTSNSHAHNVPSSSPHFDFRILRFVGMVS